jgi:DNA-binding response OmpR family regulator
MGKTKGHSLCVDDDADTRQMLTALFAFNGYEVHATDSIAHALRLTFARNYDLVVLDWMLSDGTGIELCTVLRSIGMTVSVLFYTGLDLTSEQMKEALVAGAQGFLIKPIDANDILQKVSGFLDQPKTSH